MRMLVGIDEEKAFHLYTAALGQQRPSTFSGRKLTIASNIISML